MINKIKRKRVELKIYEIVVFQLMPVLNTHKIFVNGFYHLVEPVTGKLYAFDPTGKNHILIGLISLKTFEILYRVGWEKDVALIKK